MSQAECPRCGAQLEPGQEWCLECGAPAATRVIRPPGLALPMLVVAAVVVLAGAAAAVAVDALRDEANTDALRPERTVTIVTTKTDGTRTGRTVPGSEEAKKGVAGSDGGSGGALAQWPAGQRGWTVVLLSTSSQPGAEAFARKVAQAGGEAGVLRSDDYPSLRPGLWVVFSGRHSSAEKAAEAAEAARASGIPDAYVRLVDPNPGR